MMIVIADEFPCCLEMDAMLGPLMPYQPNEFDRKAFEIYVPNDHHLRKALKCIDWSEFYDLLAPFYSETRGQPSEPPVLMLKLEYLRYHYNLSDAQVILRSTTDLAFACSCRSIASIRCLIPVRCAGFGPA